MQEKPSAVDIIVDLLTERIHNHTYPPGTKLPSERKLQEEFGTGRLALREAISRMNALGLTKTSHGKGTFVQNQLQSSTLKNMLIPYFALDDSKRLKDFVEARAMLESEIAGLAARQRTDSDIRKLESILQQNVDSDTPVELVAYIDLQFHKEMALIIDNHFLILMHEAITSHIRLFLNAFVRKKNNPRSVLDAHWPILEAISNGKEEDARRLLRKHISFSLNDYEEFVRQEHGK